MAFKHQLNRFLLKFKHKKHILSNSGQWFTFCFVSVSSQKKKETKR